MSLRRRAVLATTLVLLGAVAVTAVTARALTSATLTSTIDDDLGSLGEVAPRALSSSMGGAGPRADTGGDGGGGDGLDDTGGPRLGELREQMRPMGGMRGPLAIAADGPVQILDRTGGIVRTSAIPPLPVSDAAAAVAAGGRGATFETVAVDDGRVRIHTIPLTDGGAVQLARSLAEVDAALDLLTTRLLVLGLVLAAVAGGVALLLADRVLRPVARLTTTVEHVAETGDLDTRIGAHGEDELARLARSFDVMLARLEEARRAQTQLIADASHALRTPLTSLRTNIDLLRSGSVLPAEDQERLLADLGDQLVVFGSLVDDLVELARGESAPDADEVVRLDDLARAAVEAADRDHPGATVRVETEPVSVGGDRRRLERAIRNLIDNAVVHGGGDVTVRVGVAGTEAHLEVADRGPGLPDDLSARAFERFVRGADARGRAGSGLGLAIVAQTARTHGGTARIDARRGGGTLVTLTVPRRS